MKRIILLAALFLTLLVSGASADDGIWLCDPPTNPPGDANRDKVVDMLDWSIVATAYGTAVGDLLFDVRADFNCDGQVALWDIFVVMSNYGRTMRH